MIFTVFSFFLFQGSFMAIANADSLNGAGKQLFEFHCAGCHVNGGNIIRRGKTLRMKALHKYHYDSVEAIADIITKGKNNMSAFSDRLTEPEIKQVAEYVFQKAENNWK